MKCSPTRDDVLQNIIVGLILKASQTFTLSKYLCLEKVNVSLHIYSRKIGNGLMATTTQLKVSFEG